MSCATTPNPGGVGLLLAAHGEQQNGGNAGVHALAATLAERGVAAEVAAGFIKGVPSIEEALASLSTPRVVIYPLFTSNGYFTRDRLVQLLDLADVARRVVEVLPPFGLDPQLPQLILAEAERTAARAGFDRERWSILLLAHGSRRSNASHDAAMQIASSMRALEPARILAATFLEQAPFPDQALAQLSGPVVVIGLFSGEGLHGASDARRLVAEAARADVIYAGVVGRYSGIEDLVAASVAPAIARHCMPAKV